MKKKNIICEICGSQSFREIANEIREGPGIILECNQCGLVLQDIHQTENELKKYYNEEYQRTNSRRLGVVQTPSEHFNDTKHVFDKVLSNIMPYLGPEKKVLEIGCGSGGLLNKIKPYVKEVVGTEFNEEFIDFVKDQLNITAYSEDINQMDIPDKSFDLILCIMTLDHMPNPTKTLSTMKRLIKDDGIIYLEVPNRDVALNDYLLEPNKHLFNTFFWHKAHYFYFTKTTLEKILSNVGLIGEFSCRHEYTFVNFLNWYFCGTPQKAFVDATLRSNLYQGTSTFESRMNTMISEVETKFHTLLSETYTGDTVCCIARKKNNGRRN